MGKPLLLVGPLWNGREDQIGGTTVLFQDFVEHLKNHGYKFKLIDSNHYNGVFYKIRNAFYVLIHIVFKLPKSSFVFLNLNKNGLLFIAPFILLLSKLAGKKIAVRLFGGKGVYSNLGYFGNFIKSLVFKQVEFLFVETKEQVQQLVGDRSNVYWFPNCRHKNLQFIERSYRKKFVFISQVRKKKGIVILLESIKALDNSFTLDIYGPIIDSELSYVKDAPNYKGIIPSKEVCDVLDKYDILVLPTIEEGEGYPGIILEAYSMSIPVITSSLPSISEIVENESSGILITPGSTNELVRSMLGMNENFYKNLNIGAYKMATKFESEEVHHRILQIISKDFKLRE
ncbi:MAG: glycosyltransferase family 4 protein [Saprospiraceae bacterium]|nr:glycosyltransferase family 4 protein [Saprospiraceae bacterium]